MIELVWPTPPTTPKKQRGKPERFAAAARALIDVTHAAHQDDETTTVIRWEREDAVAVVGAVAAPMGQVWR